MTDVAELPRIQNTDEIRQISSGDESPLPLDYATTAIAPQVERRLIAPVETESNFSYWLTLATAILIAVLYFAAMHQYWAPAHPGVDQNGYLVGGRQFAATFSTGVKPANPFQYFGAMWVMAEDGWLYPKYPLGIPILTAACMWIGGEANGPILTYYIAPICASLAIVAMFLLTRQIAGGFAGLLAAALLATNPIFLYQTNNPWSHMPDLAFVLWGLTFLMWWWRYDGLWRAAIGGFLLGYAVTIRYTEGLLLLPMAVVCLSKLRWRSWRSYVTCAAPLFAWMIPVAYLLVFNKLAMGTWTGYDTTNESTGFEVETMAQRWRTTFELLYSTGAFFILPMGFMGLLLVFRASWRIGLFLLAWFLPGVMLYSSYYWAGMGNMNMGFLRFFLTLIPPLIVGACWLFATFFREASTVADGGLRPPYGWMRSTFGSPQRAVCAIAVGVIVALTSTATLRNTLPHIERDMVQNTNLATTAKIIRLYTAGTAPADGILFAESGGVSASANYLQFATGFEIYAHDAFNAASPARWNRRVNDPDQPDPLQPRRGEAMRAAYANLKDADLIAKQNQIVTEALNKGRRVFVAMPTNQVTSFTKRFLQGKPYKIITLTTWRDPAKLTDVQANQPIAENRRRNQQPPGGLGGGPGGGPGLFGGGPPGGGPQLVQRDMQLIEIKKS